jgi:hypothetical protein
MSDTAEVRVKSVRQTRRAPIIAVDRPPLRPGRMLFGFILGAGAGLLIGFLHWWALGRSSNAEGIPIPSLGWIAPFWLTYALLGLLCGLAWAFMEGRAVAPRREIVEVEVATTRLRRRSRSSELQRRRR